jgi:hypothetical protein
MEFIKNRKNNQHFTTLFLVEDQNAVVDRHIHLKGEKVPVFLLDEK